MNTRYNPRYPMVLKPWWSAVFAAVLMWCASAAAADLTQPAEQLARDIVAITGPGAAAISYRNQSSLSAEQIDVVRRAIENQLRASGVRLVATANAAAEIRVTFSESIQRHVWVAEVQQGSDVKVAIASAERVAAAASTARPSAMSMRKSLLWSQPSPVLDVLVLTAGTEPVMFVLDASGVTLLKKVGSAWQSQQQFAIPRDNAWPRDLRGRLVPARDHFFDAYLPGTICASNSGPSLAITCRMGDDPWPIAAGQSAFFSPTRNFFTGVLAPAIGKQGSVAPFYSAAALPRSRYTLWAFTRTDGTAHALDGVNDIPLRAAWGSDIAAVNSGCGAGTQLIATGTSDANTADTLRAFELADRDPVEVASANDLSGPITALWAASDAHAALAVVHNLKTGIYDAFELAITCGQ